MENPVRASLPSGPRCFLELEFRGKQSARTAKSPYQTTAFTFVPRVGEQPSLCGALSPSPPYLLPPPAQWTPGRAGDPSSATAGRATPPQQRETLGASSPELCVPILLSPFLASCRICLGLSLRLLTSSTPCHTQPHGAVAHQPRTHTLCAHRCTGFGHCEHTLSTHRYTVHTHWANTDTLHKHA